jgi:short-subunit dehydrogenase
MFAGKTVVITGASSGLGESLALELAKKNANLSLFDRNEEGLQRVEKLCKDKGAEVSFTKGDVTSPDDCKKLVINTIEKFGSIDYLVLSAGVSMWAKFDEVTDLSLFRKLIETNYLGSVNCTYFALPHLKKSKGMIVVITSIQGKISVPYHTGYVASKHALIGFFDTLQMELKGSGIDILQVLPHWLRGTNLRSNAFDKDGSKVGDSRVSHSKESVSLEECTVEIIKAMKKRKRELIIPSKLKILLWLKSISPGIAERIISGKVKEQK